MTFVSCRNPRLHFAAALDAPNAIRDLLAAGADANARLRSDGQPLSRVLVSQLRALVTRNLSNWTRDGETPLHMAAALGAEKASLALLNGGADVRARTSLGWTPLHYAAWSDSPGVVDALLSRGADMNAREARVYGLASRTPLQVAVEAGSAGAASALRGAGAR